MFCYRQCRSWFAKTIPTFTRSLLAVARGESGPFCITRRAAGADNLRINSDIQYFICNKRMAPQGSASAVEQVLRALDVFHNTADEDSRKTAEKFLEDFESSVSVISSQSWSTRVLILL